MALTRCRAKAAEILSKVNGMGSRHEKTKKKRSTYRGAPTPPAAASSDHATCPARVCLWMKMYSLRFYGRARPTSASLICGTVGSGGAVSMASDSFKFVRWGVSRQLVRSRR